MRAARLTLDGVAPAADPGAARPGWSGTLLVSPIRATARGARSATCDTARQAWLRPSASRRRWSRSRRGRRVTGRLHVQAAFRFIGTIEKVTMRTGEEP